MKGLRCPDGEKLVSVSPENGTVPCSTRKRCQLAFCPPGRLTLAGCDLLLKVMRAHKIFVYFVSGIPPEITQLCLQKLIAVTQGSTVAN